MIKFVPQSIDFDSGRFQSCPLRFLLMLQFINPFYPPIQFGLGKEWFGGSINFLRSIFFQRIFLEGVVIRGNFLKLLQLVGCGFNSTVSAPQIIESFLQGHQFFLRTAIIEHVLTNELSQVLGVLDTNRLVENGHRRSIPQICIHKEHGLEFLVIGSEGIKGSKVSLLYDSTNVVNVTQFIEITFHGELSFFDQVNFFDLATRQAPQDLSHTDIRLVRFIVKMGQQDRVGFTGFPKGFFPPLTGGRIMNFRIAPRA